MTVFCWTVPVVSNQPWSVLVGGGEYKYYHFAREPPVMCVAWEISPSLGCYVDNESIPLNAIYLYFKTELWHLYKSLLPSAKGLSIYFYAESSSSY